MYVWQENRTENQMKTKPFDQLTMGNLARSGAMGKKLEKCARAFVCHAHKGKEGKHGIPAKEIKFND